MGVARGGGCCFLEDEKMEEGIAVTSATSSVVVSLAAILLAVLIELAADMRNLLGGSVPPESPSCVLLEVWDALA